MEQVISFVVLALLVKAFNTGIDLMIAAWREYRALRAAAHDNTA